jgi:alkylated DNA nucleotide flippase Atl1
MTITQLFSKQVAHTNLRIRECETLELKRGYGIINDANATVGSPRQVLLVSLPTLAQFDLQPGQLRENIVVDGIVEDFMSGQVLQLGQTALVRLTHRCEPCAMLETLQPGLAKKLKDQRGMLGMVVRDGIVDVGDAVTLVSHQFPPIPNTTRGKFEEFVSRIPIGKVVRTSDLLLALGLTNSYYRSIPTFLKKSPPHIPSHRIVAANGELLLKHIPHQYERLCDEGVELVNYQVTHNHYWEPIYFHDLGSF